MFVFRFILFTLIFTVHNCKVPDKVYCATTTCDTPLSKAKTLLTYNSVEPNHLSFKANSEAIVYMKSAGTNPDFWYASIDGKSGFVNKGFLREHKIITKNPEVIVPVEVRKASTLQPNKVQQPHEVFEGTTIYNAEATTESVVPPAFKDDSILEPNPIHNEVHNGPIQEENVKSSTPIINESEKTEDIPQEAPMVTTSDSDPNIINESFSSPIPLETIQASSDQLSTGSESKTVEPMDKPELLATETNKEEGIPQAQALLSSVTGNLNSAPTVGILDNNDLLKKSLKQPEQNESKDQQNNSQIVNDSSAETPLQVDKKINNENNMETPQENIPQLNLIPPAVENGVENYKAVANLANEAGQTLPSDAKTLPALFGNSIQETSSEKSADVITSTTTNPLTIINNMNINSIPMNNNNKQSNQEKPQYEYTQETPDSPPSFIHAAGPIEYLTTTQSPALYESYIESLTTPNPVEHPTSSDSPIKQSTTSRSPVDELTTSRSPIEDPTTSRSPIDEPTTSGSPREEPTTSRSPVEEPTTSKSSIESITSEKPVSNHVNTETIPSNSEEYSQNFDSNSQHTTEIDLQSLNSKVEHTTDIPIESQEAERNLADEQNGGGFLSNMYITVSEMWSTTEKPIIENIFINNPEDKSETDTYESTPEPYYEEKPDSIETENGFSFLSYFMSTYNSVLGTNIDSKALFPAPGETCFTDEYCSSESGDKKSRFLTFLMTTATSVLLFTLGYYYLENRKQDSKLINTINGLQRDLLCSTKECEILKEELSSTKTKLAGIEDSSFGVDDMVVSLKEEINEIKAQNERLRNSLDDNEKLLKVSENTAGELQNTLSEVENTLSELWAERANSDEQIAELNGKVQAFEEELMSVSRDRDNFQLKYVSAESALEDLKKQLKNIEEMRQQLADSANTIELQRHEIKALKEALKDLKNSGSGDIDVTSLIDHTEIKAKLNKALEENNLLTIKFEAEHTDRVRLSEELKTAQETLKSTSQQATEAVTRLEVLGKYFQDRESELLKELNAKEALWLSKQGESTSTVEKIELLQQELQRYKEKCDTLTRELAEQESSHRAAISDLETRAHSAWLEARANKRDADAARDDAATLRRKLAHHTSVASPTPKLPSGIDVDGVLLPPPLPPPLFLPPPLLPPLPRPPPLGRLPSPRPARYSERRYSPDSRYSPESRYSGTRYSPESRYSPETVRHSPDSRYSPRRRSPYTSPRFRRRSRSRDRYDGRGSRSRIPDTETEYNSDSPTREARPRRGYSRHSGPSSGSGCSSESDK